MKSVLKRVVGTGERFKTTKKLSPKTIIKGGFTCAIFVAIFDTTTRLCAVSSVRSHARFYARHSCYEKNFVK